jgi:hypothetical protein
MAFDEFSQDLHLTPSGWIPASDKSSIPSDRVASYTVTSRQERQFDSGDQVTALEYWRSDSATDEYIAELKSKFKMPV